MNRLGILGGTFNPVHVGHLIVAERVREVLGLQKILFVPSSVSPHKQDREVADGHQRLDMLRLAVAGNPSFDVSDVELERGGVSFTVDTLLGLRERWPGHELFFLIGMDNLPEFRTWKEPERILALATIVVMTRPGFERKEAGLEARENIILCEVPPIGVASSTIREKVRNSRSIRYLVPREVEAYIQHHNLYR